MADLTDIQAAEPVKIVGSDATGLENTPVTATTAGGLHTNLRNNAGTEVGTDAANLKVADILNSGGTQGALTVGTSAVEIKVGSTPFANRKSVTLYNNSGNTMYWGYTSAVTTSTGTPILKETMAAWSVGPSTTIYVISSNTGQNARITEGS